MLARSPAPTLCRRYPCPTDDVEDRVVGFFPPWVRSGPIRDFGVLSGARWDGRRGGMVIGMATRKITVTLDEHQVEEIRALVAAGQAANVSAFVQHAVKTALNDAAGWKEMIEEALRQTGGPLTQDERAWADELLSGSVRKSGKKGRRAA